MEHREFEASAQGKCDYKVDVIPIKDVHGQPMMCICADEGAIYVTEEQAKKFFGLEEYAMEGE